MLVYASFSFVCECSAYDVFDWFRFVGSVQRNQAAGLAVPAGILVAQFYVCRAAESGREKEVRLPKAKFAYIANIHTFVEYCNLIDARNNGLLSRTIAYSYRYLICPACFSRLQYENILAIVRATISPPDDWKIIGKNSTTHAFLAGNVCVYAYDHV